MNPYGDFLRLCSYSDSFVKIRTSCAVCIDEIREMNFKGNLMAVETAAFSTYSNENQSYIPVCLYHHPKIIGSSSRDNHRGSLRVRTGPMFSSKTTWLINQLTHLAQNKFRVLLVRFLHDDRKDVYSNDGKVSTHNRSYSSLTSDINIRNVSCLKNVDTTGYDVIGVDETHFFADFFVSIVKWIHNGIHVRCVGLDGKFNMEPFNDFSLICSYSDSFKKLVTRCKNCVEELEKLNFKGNIVATETAAFSARLEVFEGNTKIGGQELYVPVCFFHHNMYI